MALTVTIGGVDRTAALQHGSLAVTTTKETWAGSCDFILVNIIPAMAAALVVADGATTYFSGYVRSIAVNEWKVGSLFCRVSGKDTAPTASDAIAPFALSDVGDEATYADLMTGTNTTLGGWSDPSIWVPYEWWRLGEPSGTTATGEMGLRDGTYVDTPTMGVTSPMATGDTAITLNGSSEYVACGAYMLAGQTDFSIAAWAKSSAGGSQTIYSEQASAGGNPLLWFYLNSSGRPALMLRDNAGATDTVVPSSGDWTDGAWHLFVASKDGDTARIYVDGLEVASDLNLANSDTISGTLLARIGNTAFSGDYFSGSIDEVMIWREALDVVMVRQLYAMRDVRPYVSLSIDSTYGAATTTTTGSVSTFDAGLAPGQVLCITSANLGMHAIELYIQDLRTTWVNDATPLYTATYGDAPLHLAAAFP